MGSARGSPIHHCPSVTVLRSFHVSVPGRGSILYFWKAYGRRSCKTAASGQNRLENAGDGDYLTQNGGA